MPKLGIPMSKTTCINPSKTAICDYKTDWSKIIKNSECLPFLTLIKQKCGPNIPQI